MFPNDFRKLGKLTVWYTITIDQIQGKFKWEVYFPLLMKRREDM